MMKPVGESAPPDDRLTEKTVGFKIPEGDLVDLDKVVAYEKQQAKGHSVTRSSLIRAAVRLFLDDRLKRITIDTTYG